MVNCNRSFIFISLFRMAEPEQQLSSVGLYMWQHNGVTVDVQDRRALFRRVRDGMCKAVEGSE